VSIGVKVTLSLGDPAPGAVVEDVQAKVPDTDAVPPVSVDEASVWPYVIAPAAGQAVTVGVVLVVPPPPEFDPPPHPAAQKLARIPSQIAARRPIIFITQPLLSISSSSIGFRSYILCPAESPAHSAAAPNPAGATEPRHSFAPSP
jgi:hypothetical protein